MCFGSGTPQEGTISHFAHRPERFTITEHTMGDGTVVTQVYEKDDDSYLFFVGKEDNTGSNWKYGINEARKYLGKQMLKHVATSASVVSTSASTTDTAPQEDTILVRTA